MQLRLFSVFEIETRFDEFPVNNKMYDEQYVSI